MFSSLPSSANAPILSQKMGPNCICTEAINNEDMEEVLFGTVSLSVRELVKISVRMEMTGQ